MKILDSDIYFGKKMKVFSIIGIVTVGDFFGYNYDYDDDGNEFVEFDVEREDGFLIGFTEGEVERIEIVDGRKDHQSHRRSCFQWLEGRNHERQGWQHHCPNNTAQAIKT